MGHSAKVGEASSSNASGSKSGASWRHALIIKLDGNLSRQVAVVAGPTSSGWESAPMR